MIPESIPKKTGTSGNFERLRREGIQLVQDLSGQRWTDFNLHDPGVTILEQLCYALTELIYQAEFPIEDLLTREDGVIDFERQALYPPQQIFPCRPITVMDYRKTLLDAIPEIDNVWLESVDADDGAGLYRVVVKLASDVEPNRYEEIDEAVRRQYHRTRNLCEDLDEVMVLQPIECELFADIEIAGVRDPNLIAADVYHRCSVQLAMSVGVHAYDDVLNRGVSLEHVFEGPMTRHGIWEERDLLHTAQALGIRDRAVNVDEILNVLMTKVFAAVTRVEGVQRIRTLSLQADRAAIDRLSDRIAPELALCLRVPQREEAVNVKLIKNERVLPLSLERIRARYDELRFKHRSTRLALHDIDRMVAIPSGQYRGFLDYFSIQNHFPAVYGIHAHGVSDSAPSDVKARALQLRSYLLLFEQILADYAANLHHVRDVFSIGGGPQPSYFFQALTNTHIPGIEQVYTRPPSTLLRALITEGYDALKGLDRTNRVLDYLLALYGEKFTQFSLRHFNPYDPDDEIEAVIVRNKREFLKCVVEINQHRTGGFRCGEPAWNTNNISSLQKKVSLLLGVPHWEMRSYTDVFIEKGLELLSDEQFAHIKEGAVELEYVDLEDIDDRTRARFEIPSAGISAGKGIRQLFQEILFLKNNVVSESILRHGIDLNRYRVGSTGRSGAFQIAFKPDDRAQWMYIAAYPTKDEAMGVVNDLRALLIDLNKESEGLHIVEHVLLRSRQFSSKTRGPAPHDFYAFRISVMFPGWTARFHHAEFRRLAEETVRLNCPAHIYPECYWLGFEDMEEFELLYKTWLELLGAAHPSIPELDHAAHRLTEFLLERREARAPCV